jgi:hypothetical protein
MQGPRDQPMAASEKLSRSKWRSGADSLPLPKLGQRFGVERLFTTEPGVHSTRLSS